MKPQPRSQKRDFLLPGFPRTATKDVMRYARAWKRLGRPIAKATGTELYGFDPTLSFTEGLHLGVGHAISLYKAITGKKFHA